ncbi:MAG TPA: NUDIX domain-containing protein [Thermoanaerobaculia bacterium]|nr:NUDIX domain-containing protein [Thermoanaerobaculia bacterium]
MIAPDPPRRRLAEALRRHEPADASEARHRDAILALVENEPACFARTTWRPGHVTGSAFIVRTDVPQVLLHHHRRLDAWLQMGGHDDGEHDPAATALREGAEESGLPDLAFLSPGILDLDVHEIPERPGQPAHRHHDVRYALVTRLPEAICRDASESLDLRWFPFGEAERLMAEPGGTRALRRLARLLESSGAA